MGINREHVILFGRFVAIGIIAPLLAWMLSRAWQPGTLAWEAVAGFSGLIAFGDGVPIEMLPSMVLGGYFGLLVLFTLDARKRYQGALLLFGTVLGLGVLTAFDTLLANIDLADPFNWISFGIGFGFGLLVERSQFQDLMSTTGELEQDDLQFTRASMGLFVLLTAVVVAGLLQSTISGTLTPIFDVPATAAFVYLLFGFIQYDAESDVAVIGPRESGKSLLLLALYLVYRERRGAGGADGYMRDLIRQATTMRPGDDFPIANTKNLEKLWFYVTSGRIFPKRVKISVTDHTGEYLTRLGDNLSEPLSLRDKIEVMYAKYVQANPSTDLSFDGQNLLFEHEVRNADVVLLLLDIERLEQGDTEHITDLQNVGERAKQNGAEVIVVATKCDLLIDEFAGFSKFVDNPLAQGLEDEFGKTVDRKLRSTNLAVDELVDAVDADRIYPVYYETQEINGDLVPALDDNHNLQHQGTEDLADRLEDTLRT